MSLAALIETSLAPYRSEALSATVGGPEVILSGGSITPLGLMLHEMTTNAVKYGGWSQPGGSIAVEWTCDDGMVALTWRESGVAIVEQPTRQGFGSMLMTSSVRQLGGTVDRRFDPDGAVIAIRFPSTS